MKLFITLCLSLSLLTSGLSGPLDDYRTVQTMDYWEDIADSQQTSDDDSEDAVPLPENIEEQLQSPDEEIFQQSMYYADMEDDSSQMMGWDNENLPTESVKELKYMLAKPNKGGATAQASCTKKALQHGGILGLQFGADGRRWLGCPASKCDGRTCPQLCMRGTDWTRCWGEVFKIYRALGPGTIQSGDFVGLYYIKDKRWFSMFGKKGHKQTCPGTPKTSTGFNHLYNWFFCGGEVFQIYANGKALGAAIEDRDYIVLYHPAAASYVQFNAGIINLNACPAQKSSNARPPKAAAYDECLSSVAKLTVK